MAETEISLVPEPIDCDDVVLYVDKVLLVPHSKEAVVDKPFGFTKPTIVAEFVKTDEEAVVETPGKPCTTEIRSVWTQRNPMR